ncbi:hypothetical protein PSU4_07540 [Pseudonocardia sulfidoxydans NBRC 16205]|uniref:Uncharacterized protein n=1 Tax=Pseudonocardia sulfidoxydans NBRC 16205 TaxID=1223511 RepID=A0A511DAG1_9PSEU|nr:hypothetical protein [Pseudonocardia sulfidoxydans]GEL21800.1 hypothetical protein PSU4_07540 [Pseudonocardia sulfidoxydans NBRC 16205]
MTLTSTRADHVRPVVLTGLAVTVAAATVPYLDHLTGDVLGTHIGAGYPAYGPAEVGTATWTWLAVLTVVGVLGVAGWLGTARALRAGRGWARGVATTLFVAGTAVALAGLLTRDTSGDTGLPPLLGWVGLAPSVVGLAVVVLLWRRTGHG